MLAVLLVGYLAQYFIRQPAGDYASLVRLGEMASFTLLLLMPKRLLGVHEESVLVPGISETPLRIDVNLIHSMLSSIQRNHPQYYQELTHLVVR
jgi:hypothetical protein